MTKAIAISGMGNLSVIETNYPAPTPTLTIKKDIATKERIYIWDPLEERLEYCRVLSAFFELGDTEAQWKSNAVILKNALDSKATSVTFSVVFGTKKAISKTLAIQLDAAGNLFAVLQEGGNPTYDKRVRLPVKKGTQDPLTKKYPYLMNLEIKLNTSQSWADWDRDWATATSRNLVLHTKYINIHLNLPPKP